MCSKWTGRRRPGNRSSGPGTLWSSACSVAARGWPPEPRAQRGAERKTHTLVEYIIGGFVPRRGAGKIEGKARQRLNFTATTPRYWRSLQGARILGETAVRARRRGRAKAEKAHTAGRMRRAWGEGMAVVALASGPLWRGETSCGMRGTVYVDCCSAKMPVCRRNLDATLSVVRDGGARSVGNSVCFWVKGLAFCSRCGIVVQKCTSLSHPP